MSVIISCAICEKKIKPNCFYARVDRDFYCKQECFIYDYFARVNHSNIIKLGENIDEICRKIEQKGA